MHLRLQPIRSLGKTRLLPGYRNLDKMPCMNLLDLFESNRT